MKSKSIAVLVVCGIFISACGKTNDVERGNQKTIEDYAYYQYTDIIDESNIRPVSVLVNLAIDFSDVTVLRDASTNVFIGTVDRIDGASTMNTIEEWNSLPHIYGKVTVLQSLKGEINQEVIDFTRSGGVISIEEFEKNLPQEWTKSKMTQVEKANTYERFELNRDIELEAGKTYLFFANYIPETGEYRIEGLEHGAREIKQEITNQTVFRTMPDVDTLKVKHNVSGEYEQLTAFIHTYFS